MGKYSDLLNAQSVPQLTAPGKFSRMLEPEKTVAPEPMAQPQQEEGWGEWIVNSVKGRKDPAFEGVGTVFEQFSDDLRSPTATAAMLNASDAQMTDIIANTLGDRVLRREKDAGGYDVLVTRGPDGKEQKGYVNQPGLDTQDMWRTLYGVAPFAATGGAIGGLTKGANWLVQGLAQGAGAGATSLAADVAQIPLGSEQFVEPEKALINTGLGAAAPPLAAAGGALWRRFVTIPGMVDNAGNLTPKGAEAAKQAGLNPADLSPDMAKEFAASYAKSGDAALAAARTDAEPFGIPVTQGQTTKRPFLLNQEEKMRRGLYGGKAEREMLSFDALQRQRIEEAATGGGPKPGVGQTINPDRLGRERPQVLGRNVQETVQNARETARKAESQLWETGGVKELAATDEALATLRPRIQSALADETAFTQTGEAMAKTIGEFAEKNLPVSEAGGIQLKKVQTVDQMRRRLFQQMKEAEPGSDQRQAGMIYDAFNDWIGESAEKSLLAGDPLAAAQLVKARAFTREVRELFSPTTAGGKKSPGAARLQKVLETADSGEGVVNALFGSQGSRSVSEGTVTALRQAKSILDKFGGDGGKQAWDDIRLAYWMRLVTGKNGEVVGAQALTNNVKTALENHASVLRTLYTPDEIAMMRWFMRGTERAAYKPPNASGSGYTAAEAMKEMVGKLLNFLPGSQYVRGGLEMSGIPNQAGAIKARAATNQSVPVRNRNITPAVTGLGSSQSRE